MIDQSEIEQSAKMRESDDRVVHFPFFSLTLSES